MAKSKLSASQLRLLMEDISDRLVTLGEHSMEADQLDPGSLQRLKAEIEKLPFLNKFHAEIVNLFNFSPELLCVAGIDGKFQKVNPAFHHVLGYSEEELLSRPFADFIHPDDVEKTAKEVEKLGSGIPTIHFENRYRCKDGSYRILSWDTYPDQDQGLLYAAARDVTGFRKKEEEQSQIIEAIDHSAIVVMTDLKGKITRVNDNFCHISGYSREELIGQDHRIVNSGAHSKTFFKKLWETILAGKVWTGEIQNRAKDGHFYFVQTVISPLRDELGNITQFIAVRFDKTKQKESERLLEEAESVARIGSWSFDLASQEFSWSRQMYVLFNENPESGLPTVEKFLATIHPEDQIIWKQKFGLCQMSKTCCKLKIRSLQGNGQVKWIEIIGESVVNNTNEVIGLRGTCQDVTELVEADEKVKLERAKALQAAKLASLGEMSAGIAHEINNPLAIITGMTWILPNVVNDPVQFQKKIDAINRASERISKIVGGLRKFSRSSDKSDKKAHQLLSIVAEAISLTQTKSRRHTTPVLLDQNTSGPIICDEIEIEQVLVNLINNSIDAVKDAHDRWVKMQLSETNSEIVLRISDSGQGIPEHVQKKLFQPFFTTKEVGEGTGLGLSIVKGILDDHKASIELLANQPHTCFEIRFPKQTT
jgi:PAS domain S-box-containing protein